MSFPNRFPGACRKCGSSVPAQAGITLKLDGKWRVECAPACPEVPVILARPAKPAAVGDLSGILALFAKAKAHLKFPAIVIGVPVLGAGVSIRINVAGERAKVPGSLTIVDGERDEGSGERAWLGRILLDGTFQPSKLGGNPAIAARLREFAADPANIAGEDGRLHGRCCFCRKALSDERSTIVGYGRICAGHFGLPWGAAKHSFKAEAVMPEEARAS